MSTDESFDRVVLDKWPEVFIDIWRPPTDMTEVDRFQQRLKTLLTLAVHGSERVPANKIFLMMNLDGILGATFEQQLRAAAVIADVRDLARAGIRATALIVRNDLVRMVLEIILKLQPLQSQYKIFESQAAAEEWIASIAH